MRKLIFSNINIRIKFAVIAIHMPLFIADEKEIYRKVLEIIFAEDNVLPSNVYQFRG